MQAVWESGTILNSVHPEMTIPGLALSAISFQSRHGGTKTYKKQVIKLIVPLKPEWLTAPS